MKLCKISFNSDTQRRSVLMHAAALIRVLFFLTKTLNNVLSKKPISITTCSTTSPFCTWGTTICRRLIRLFKRFWARRTFCRTDRLLRLHSVSMTFCCTTTWELATECLPWRSWREGEWWEWAAWMESTMCLKWLNEEIRKLLKENNPSEKHTKIN